MRIRGVPSVYGLAEGGGLGPLAHAGGYLLLHRGPSCQSPEEGVHIGEAVLRFHGQRLQDRLLHVFREGDPQLRRRLQGIPVDPLHGVRRQRSGDAAVQGGAHGVHVRPGPLVAVAGILLLRRVAVLEDDRHAFPVPQGEPRRAEVQQPALPLRGDVDVVRADIPVQEVERVHLDQRLHDGLEDRQRLGIGDLAPLIGQIRLEAHPVDVLHDEIGGVVLLEVILHRDHMGRVLQLGQDLRLIQEAVHAVLVVLLHPPGACDIVPVRVPRGNRGGHILLDGDLDLQRQVVPEIGDPEAADPQHLPQHVPSVQQGPQGQSQIGLLLVLIESAVGADAARLFFLEAAKANAFRIHTLTSSIPVSTHRSSPTPRTRSVCRRTSASSHLRALSAFRNSIWISRGST